MQSSPPFDLKDTEYLNRYFAYLKGSLNKGLNSINTLANFSEIHRVLFNFCETNKGKSPAMQFALADKPYTAQELLEEAIVLNENLPQKD